MGFHVARALTQPAILLGPRRRARARTAPPDRSRLAASGRARAGAGGRTRPPPRALALRRPEPGHVAAALRRNIERTRRGLFRQRLPRRLARPPRPRQKRPRIALERGVRSGQGRAVSARR